MKKFLKLSIFVIMAFFGVLVFSSCGLGGDSSKKDDDSRVSITSEMISRVDSLDYDNGNPVEFESTQIHIVLDRVDLRLGKDFTITYSNNINAGTATATLTINEDNAYAKGSATFDFEIKPAGKLEVATYQDFKQAFSDTNHRILRLINTPNEDLSEPFVIPEGEVLTLGEGKYLYFAKSNGYKIYNYGKLVILGGQYSGLVFNSGTFYNYGEIECHGEASNKAEIYNAGIMTFDENKKIDNRGRLYTNTPIDISPRTSTNPLDYWGAKYVLRSAIPEEDVSLQSGSVEYVSSGAEPSILYKGETPPNALFKYNYRNNTQVGQTATVEIDVNESNQTYYGHFVRNYTITKGSTTVADFEELKIAQDEGCYYNYTLSGNLEIDEDFSLSQDEILNFSSGMTVAEDVILTNIGTISTSTFVTITIDGTLKNYGTINCSKTIIKGTGELETYTDSTISISSLGNNWQGNITNGGILLASNNCIISGNLTNGGSFTCPVLSLVSGTLNNSGTITINGTTTGDWGTANIYNTGKIINSVKTSYDNRSATFENVQNGIETTAEIWTYNSLQNVNNNVVLRKNLDDAEISLSEYSYEYDQTSHKPILFIDGEEYSGTISTPSYTYSSGAQDSTCSNAGTINVSLVIKDNDKFCKYYGACSESYTINKVEAQILSSSNFTRLLNNSNYSGYKLMADIAVSTDGYYSIYSGQIFDTNGYKLVLSTGVILSVQGTLLVNSVERDDLELSNVALRLTNNGFISIGTSGEIINRDVIYIENIGTARISSNSGRISGSGKIYTHTGASIENSSDFNVSCTVYNRQDIASMNSQNLYLDNVEFTYSGIAKTPQVIANYDNNQVETDDHLVVTINDGNSCIYHGEYVVNIEAKGDFDQYFIGNTTKTFVINSNVYNITSASQWTQSTFSDSSYDRFDLKATFDATQDITLREHSILNFGTNRITNINKSTKKQISSNATSEIWITTASSEEFALYAPVATHLTLGSDITGTNGNSLIFFNFTTTSSLPISDCNRSIFVLDLNGYNITNGLFIGNGLSSEVTFTLTNSSSTISYVNTSSETSSNEAFAVNGSVGKMNLNIIGHNTEGTTKNLVIRGFFLQPNNSGCNVDLYAKDVNFNTGSTAVVNAVKIGNAFSSGGTNINVNSYFSTCHITGPTGVLIAGGTSSTKHVFDTCTITANGEYDAEVGDGILIRQVALSGYYVNVYVLAGSVTSSNGYGIYVTQGGLGRYDASVVSVYYHSVHFSHGSGKSDMYSGMINETGMFHYYNY